MVHHKKHTFRRKVAKPVVKSSTKAVKWVGRGAKKGLHTGAKGIGRAWRSLTKTSRHHHRHHHKK
jgi:hypothetical protein